MSKEEQTGELITRGEVEDLLSQVQEPQPPSPEAAGVTGGKQGEGGGQRYDFRQPAFLSSRELRRLSQRHEEFVRALGARLSIYLRIEVGLEMSKLQTASYRAYTESLPTPTHLTMFKVDPLPGVGLFEISSALGLAIVDRMLGGPAQSPEDRNELSEIEVALLDQVVQLVVSEWSAHWSKEMELRSSLIGHESHPRFLQTAPHDTVLLILTLEARLAECTEVLRIAFPCYMLEPLTRVLQRKGNENNSVPASKSNGRRPHWLSSLNEAPLRVSASWNGVEMTTREVAKLKVGDFLQLDARQIECVDIQLGRSPKFIGRLGKQGGRRAVELLKRVGDPTKGKR